MGVVYNTAGIVTDGLVLALDAANPKSYPGSGTTWTDLSGNGNNGTLLNSPVFSTQGFFSFDGSSKRATLTSPFGKSGFTTLSIWYNRDETVSSTTWRTLISTSSTNIHHLVSQQSSRNLGIWDGGFRDFTYNPLSDGKFHNYTVIYQSSVNASLYVDGNFVSTINTSLNLEISPIGSIGNWSSGNYWSGKISNIYIYNKNLNLPEIQQNFNSLRGRYGI
jgi:hypothetical protein